MAAAAPGGRRGRARRRRARWRAAPPPQWRAAAGELRVLGGDQRARVAPAQPAREDAARAPQPMLRARGGHAHEHARGIRPRDAVGARRKLRVGAAHAEAQADVDVLGAAAPRQRLVEAAARRCRAAGRLLVVRRRRRRAVAQQPRPLAARRRRLGRSGPRGGGAAARRSIRLAVGLHGGHVYRPAAVKPSSIPLQRAATAHSEPAGAKNSVQPAKPYGSGASGSPSHASAASAYWCKRSGDGVVSSSKKSTQSASDAANPTLRAADAPAGTRRDGCVDSSSQPGRVARSSRSGASAASLCAPSTTMRKRRPENAAGTSSATACAMPSARARTVGTTTSTRIRNAGSCERSTRRGGGGGAAGVRETKSAMSSRDKV